MGDCQSLNAKNKSCLFIKTTKNIYKASKYTLDVYFGVLHTFSFVGST